MNVISRRKLREFYLATPERKRHVAAFENWFRLARRTRWHTFQDTRATFGQTDVATGDSGRAATIFDIGGNKYRIVAHVDYSRQAVLIRLVMDHEEYDQGRWKKLFGSECMMQKTKSPPAETRQDSYMNLVRRFPLKTIKNDRDHARAVRVIEELMGRDLDSGSGDYLDALVVLVNKYEDEHHSIDESMTPREALRALMEFNNLNQAAIGKIIGSESAVSMFLSGSRGLSQTQIKRLCERFKVDAMTFMG